MGSGASSAILLLLATLAASQTRWWQQPAVLSPDTTAVDVQEALEYKKVPGTVLRMDVYRPKYARSELLPAVVFVHGGPIPADLPVEPRQIVQYTSLGRLVSSRGIAAVTFSHRLTSADAIDMAAHDVRDAVSFVVDHAASLGIDAKCLCIWAISASGVVIAPAFREFGQRVRCLVLYYTLLDPVVFQSLVSPNTLPGGTAPGLTDLLIGGNLSLPATLIVRAGRDNARLNDGLDRFMQAAMQRGADLELHAYASGRHGFDVFDDTPRSRELLLRTLDFVRESTVSR